ncbi:MAG: ABC transporter permease [Clostridium sp.]|nr:ABC transporter permease [Clostridium sp.]MCM1399800.1 ABC transporter permease [Clostridium sp.]MCM1459573.1 ABC transporter permease [Bacteroides sp.]
MERYNQLSKLYLKYQKKRTMLTILGVALAAGALFVILTLYFSNFINNRDRVREQANYEIVMFPETEEQVTGIINQEFVKDAYIGDYYAAYKNGSYIKNALFINTKNPYRMNQYLDTLTAEYGIEGKINDTLASYYLQGYAGDTVYITLILFLFLSVIFAIIGVGIIRNSIQLNTLEQVKDYGILRCIGATRGQLKTIIFLMGFIQEISGVALGMLTGFLVAAIIGAVSNIKVGLHIVPVLFVLVAFIGDLYFVMKENSNIVKKISPVEAVRGNFNIKKKKLKKRRKSIFGVLFGVEGDYAYKSLMGNKSRFFKSVATFALGIAAFIMISVVSSSINDLLDRRMGQYGEYQFYCFNPVGREVDIENAKAGMPSYDVLERFASEPNVEDIQPMYIARIPVADYEALYSKYNDEYIKGTWSGSWIDELNLNEHSEEHMINKVYFSQINVLGYSREEFQKHEAFLVDGTLDVSDHGLIIERQKIAYPRYEEEDDDDQSLTPEDLYGKYYQENDYQVGDTINLVDFEKFNTMFSERWIEYATMDKDKKPEDFSFSGLYYDCWNELVEEGAYETYTVEGIVEYDKEKLNLENITAIVPLENYYAMTGLGEKDSNGLKYKIKKGQGLTSETMDLLLSDDFLSDTNVYVSSFAYDASSGVNLKKSIRYISMFILFIVVMTSVNIINTSASNLYLRRGELAQLRVIGVSKKKLCYIVMLEGIITSLLANLIGCVAGFAGLIPLRQAIITIFQIDLVYPVRAAVIGVIVSTLVLCGSIYFPVIRMSKGILNDLNAGGD